jgi:hypothetical protein
VRDGGRSSSLERFQPYHRRLRPDDIRQLARLQGSVVIATGCDTGAPGLADAFLDAGADAYVAPAGAPFGYASFFAPLFLFYELTEGRTLAEAVARLQAHDRELAMWCLFRRNERRPSKGSGPGASRGGLALTLGA